ncbi:MAG: hypothetical protein ABI542_03970 [Gemmatimonadota bacterium]
MLNTLVGEIEEEQPRYIAVVLRPVIVDSPWTDNLDRNLTSTLDGNLDHRRSSVRRHGLPLAESIGWRGCPGFTDISADKSACPRREEAILATSLPYSGDVADPTVRGAKKALFVRTFSTFLAPDGAHTRIMDLELQETAGKWRIVGRRFIGYVE